MQRVFSLLGALFLSGMPLCVSFGVLAESANPTKVERVVFFGDSLTEWSPPVTGWVSVVSSGLEGRYPYKRFEFVNAGNAGDKVADLLRRLDQDVLQHEPTRVVLYIGINDAWGFAGLTGTSVERFEEQFRELVKRIVDRKVGLVVCTVSVIGEDVKEINRVSRVLDSYARIQRDVAAEFKAPVCDLRAAFVKELESLNVARKKSGIFTSDEVHLSGRGEKLVARVVGNVLGLTLP